MSEISLDALLLLTLIDFIDFCIVGDNGFDANVVVGESIFLDGDDTDVDEGITVVGNSDHDTDEDKRLERDDKLDEDVDAVGFLGELSQTTLSPSLFKPLAGRRGDDNSVAEEVLIGEVDSTVPSLNLVRDEALN